MKKQLTLVDGEVDEYEAFMADVDTEMKRQLKEKREQLKLDEKTKVIFWTAGIVAAVTFFVTASLFAGNCPVG